MFNILCFISILITFFGSTAHAGEIPFNTAGISSLRGKDICNLSGTFPKKFGLYLDKEERYVIEYRERDNVIALFLLENLPPSKECGIVRAVLDLTNLIKQGEAVEFKCHINTEGRTKWGHVVGLADNDQGHKRYVNARLAWRVNVKQKRLEEIKGETVSCDTSGYDVGDGWY